MKMVTLGRTGLIGSRVVSLLRARSHEVVAASPSKGIDSITGKGLTETLTGAQVVVDVTNAPSWEDKAVLEFFETSTRNVFAAEEKKGRGPPRSWLPMIPSGSPEKCFSFRAVYVRL